MEPYQITYLASAGADQIVTAHRALLLGVIVGKSVASSVLEVSDHVSDGDGNVVFYLEGSTLIGDYLIPGGVVMLKGITLDLANQTNVMVIWKPIPDTNID